MMPAQINITSRHLPEFFFCKPIYTMEDNRKNVTTDPLVLSEIQECFEQMNILSDYQMQNDKSSDIGDSSNSCSIKKENNLVDYVELNNCNSQTLTDDFMCLGKSEQFSDKFELNVSSHNKKYSYFKKTLSDLNKYSLKQLKILIEDLMQTVEKVSSELVQLLLENDALQQESDARNIAIEQLLKMTVKVNESDLKPVQMSVILPDDCDDV